MGLLIIPCASDDWEYSLRAERAKAGFDGLIDWRSWNPAWWEKHGDAWRKCRDDGLISSPDMPDPYDDAGNCRIYEERLKEFCAGRGIRTRTVIPFPDERIVEIDNGVGELDDFSISSGHSEFGLDRALRLCGRPDLYEIFGVSRKSREKDGFPLFVEVDWARAKTNLEDALAWLKRKGKLVFSPERAGMYVDAIRKILGFWRVLDAEGEERFRLMWSD